MKLKMLGCQVDHQVMKERLKEWNRQRSNRWYFLRHRKSGKHLKKLSKNIRRQGRSWIYRSWKKMVQGCPNSSSILQLTLLERLKNSSPVQPSQSGEILPKSSRKWTHTSNKYSQRTGRRMKVPRSRKPSSDKRLRKEEMWIPKRMKATAAN